MAINKIDIKFNNQIMNKENIEKLAKAVNDNADVVDEVVDSNGDLEAGKLNRKLYCHPIEWKYETDTRYYAFMCLIFNNSNTPFTTTTFWQYISALVNAGAKIMVSGNFCYKGTPIRYFQPINIKKSVANTVALHGVFTDTGVEDYFSLDDITPDSFSDGVNEVYPNIE